MDRMEQLTVTLTVNRADAIKAGLTSYGQKEVAVSQTFIDKLTADQRASLARCGHFNVERYDLDLILPQLDKQTAERAETEAFMKKRQQAEEAAEAEFANSVKKIVEGSVPESIKIPYGLRNNDLIRAVGDHNAWVHRVISEIREAADALYSKEFFLFASALPEENIDVHAFWRFAADRSEMILNLPSSLIQLLRGVTPGPIYGQLSKEHAAQVRARKKAEEEAWEKAVREKLTAALACTDDPNKIYGTAVAAMRVEAESLSVYSGFEILAKAKVAALLREFPKVIHDWKITGDLGEDDFITKVADACPDYVFLTADRAKKAITPEVLAKVGLADSYQIVVGFGLIEPEEREDGGETPPLYYEPAIKLTWNLGDGEKFTTWFTIND